MHFFVVEVTFSKELCRLVRVVSGILGHSEDAGHVSSSNDEQCLRSSIKSPGSHVKKKKRVSWGCLPHYSSDANESSSDEVSETPRISADNGLTVHMNVFSWEIPLKYSCLVLNIVEMNIII